MSDWRPESDGPTQLSGTWDFYWRQLLSPGDDPEGGAAPITVPSFWHRTAVAPDATAGRGFGTYRLRVKLPPDRPALAVRLGNVNTAVEVFANGLSIWRVGRVAEDLEGSVPGYRPGVAPLPPIDDPILDLVVQVSSHETDRGGLDEPVWLGRTEDLLQARSRELTLLGLLAGGLLTMGIYYLCHFAVRRRSEVSLYFGLFCLAAVGRLMCTHELLVLEIWPEIPWSLVAKGAYFFTFAIVCAFVLHLQALWPSRVPAWFFRFVFSSAGLAGAVVLATPPSLFTRTLIFLQAYVVVCVVLSVVVFASAVRSRAEGLGLYAGGFLFVAVGGVHDIAVLQGLIISPFYWGPIGAFLFLLAQAVILAQRSARSLSTVEEQRRKLLELVERLRREQRERKRYEELSLAASGVAHETKNPLGIIRGLAQRLTTAPNVDKSTKVRAAQILDQADRAASRLGDFLNYARVRDPQMSPVELDVVAGYAFEVLAPDLEAKELRSRIETGGAVVLADEEMVLQILLNLMLNSIAACEPGASLDLLFEGSEASTSTGTISVIDTGAGIPEDLLGRVRDPYVTGRADGHGLGLALVERLAELHGWALHISSRVGEGTRVEIEGVELAQDDAATEDTGRVSGS